MSELYSMKNGKVLKYRVNNMIRIRMKLEHLGKIEDLDTRNS